MRGYLFFVKEFFSQKKVGVMVFRIKKIIIFTTENKMLSL